MTTLTLLTKMRNEAAAERDALVIKVQDAASHVTGNWTDNLPEVHHKLSVAATRVKCFNEAISAAETKSLFDSPLTTIAQGVHEFMEDPTAAMPDEEERDVVLKAMKVFSDSIAKLL